MRAWLTLALLCLVPGCADDHGYVLDAGGRPDAAMCTESGTEDGDIEGLSCPASIAPGGRAVVSLTTRSRSCCPDGAALAPIVTRTMGGDDVSITAPYDLCQCCTTCRCIGSAITRDVVVAEVAGSPIHVASGGHECTIAIDSPASCHPIEATRGDAPAASAAMQPMSTHLVSDSGSSTSCGCSVHTATDPSGSVSFEACDCCDACDCIDFGYEATITQGAVEGAPLNVPITLSASPLVTTTIVDPARCGSSSAVVTGLTTLGPIDNLREGSPVHGWVHLEAYDLRCCGEPLELVTHTTASDGSIVLTWAECRADPCDCVANRRADASTAVDLGELASGTYAVHAAGLSTTVTIP